MKLTFNDIQDYIGNNKWRGKDSLRIGTQSKIDFLLGRHFFHPPICGSAGVFLPLPPTNYPLYVLKFEIGATILTCSSVIGVLPLAICKPLFRMELLKFAPISPELQEYLFYLVLCGIIFIVVIYFLFGDANDRY